MNGLQNMDYTLNGFLLKDHNVHASCGITNEIDLWQTISANFNRSNHLKYIAPTVPAAVYVALTIMTFTEIDQLRSTVSGLVYLTKSWSDPRLIKNNCTLGAMPSEGVPLTLDLLKNVWQPSIGIVSALRAHSPSMPEQFDQTILTYSEKDHNFWLTNTHSMFVTVPCLSDYVRFPFDSTECDFIISTPTSHPAMTNISWWPGAFYSISNQFNTLASHYIRTVDARKETISGVLGRNMTADIIRVKLHRFAMFYILQGYIPNIITVLVSWFSFMIRPDAVPARVSIAVSSLIAIMLQYANLVKSIPKVGYFKSIDLWMLVCVVFIFLVQAEYAVICFLKRQKKKLPPTALAAIDRAASLGLLGTFVLFSIFYFSLLSQ